MESYNAVTWLLDRNVEEGRGGKLAYTDTVSELTYRDLQKQSCRAANMLRRLGVRREERASKVFSSEVRWQGKRVEGNIMPMRIDSKRSRWLSMNYNS